MEKTQERLRGPVRDDRAGRDTGRQARRRPWEQTYQCGCILLGQCFPETCPVHGLPKLGEGEDLNPEALAPERSGHGGGADA